MAKIVMNRFTEHLAVKGRNEKRSISRRDVAAETGVALGSVQNWAANKLQRVDVRQIAIFCEYFDCSIGELLILEEDEDADDSSEIKTPLIAA
jgi:DNA-binding Xre family transcriptional regulator